MSRSKHLSEIKAGLYLVAISQSSKEGDTITVRYTSNDMVHHDQDYDYKSEDFIKLCYTIDTPIGDTIFDSQKSIGKRLWIAVKEVWDKIGGNVTYQIFDIFPYSDYPPAMNGNPLVGEIAPPFIEVLNIGSKSLSDKEKAEIIKKNKEMIKQVEGDEFDSI